MATFTDKQNELIINKLTKAQYDSMKKNGQVKEEELYVLDEFYDYQDLIIAELRKIDNVNTLTQIDKNGNYTTKNFTNFPEFTKLVQTGKVRLKYVVSTPESRSVLYTAHLCDENNIRFDATGMLGNTLYTRSIVLTNVSDNISITVDKLREVALTEQITNIVNVYKNGTLLTKQLSVESISIDDYKELLVNGNVNLSTLYVIDQIKLDGFNKQIENVAEPILSSDAATMNYVDTKFSEFKPLSGQAYDLNDAESFKQLVSDIGTFLGATIN